MSNHKDTKEQKQETVGKKPDFTKAAAAPVDPLPQGFTRTPYVAAKREESTFLVYINSSQMRDAEIAAMDVKPDEQEYFEVVTPGPMSTKVRVNKPSYEAIKRARPIIDMALV